MCRCVEDAAILFGVTVGPDQEDPVTEHGRNKVLADYTKHLDPEGLKGARIGVLRAQINLQGEQGRLSQSPVEPIFEAAIADLRRLGAIIVDPLDIPDYQELSSKDLWAKPSPFVHDVNKYFAGLGAAAPCADIREVMAAGLCDPNAKNMFHDFYLGEDPAALVAPEERGFLSAYADPRRIDFRNAIVAAMDNQKIDALIYPTCNHPPPDIGGRNRGQNTGVSPPTGLPALTIPMGYSEPSGPAGLEFLGRLFSEPTLFRLAYAYERGTLHRKPPPLFAHSTLKNPGEPVIGPLVAAAGDEPTQSWL